LIFTILITCVGGELAPQMIQELRLNSRHDIKVIGVDANIDAVGKYFCDEFSVVPFGDNPNYGVIIQKLVQLYNVDLVIPTSDEEAIAMSSSRKLIEKNGCKLACVKSETLSVLTDKSKTYHFLKKNGVHVPATKIVENYDSLKIIVESMYKEHGAVVIKPACARGGRGVYVVSSLSKGVKYFSDRREVHSDLRTFIDTLIHNLKEELPLIVMERLVEPVIDIDLLAWKGRVKRVVPRRRVNSAVPNDGHILVNDKELINLGERLIEIFQLSWLYDCDVMFDSKGNPCVLELNPRQSGSLPVSITAGVPILDDLVSIAKGESIPDIELPINRKIIPYKSLKMIDK
jgi:carbamoyl-phosphate synthase large subunit